MFVIERQQWVPAPLPQTFEFFSNAENLGLLTPPWLGFRIVTPKPISMATGTLIDYRIKLFGLPMRWRTGITDWTPGVRFSDVQLRGPYQKWEHTHSFTAMGGGTLITDRVEYHLRFGVLGRLVHSVFVRTTLARVFDYRFAKIRETFL